MKISQPAKLADCTLQGSESTTELFIVEGDSASQAVIRIRDAQFQAVLPMQGKPLNAWKANEKKVRANVFMGALIESIGCDIGGAFSQSACRYRSIILLFDPDADGIHCGTLMLLFFYRWMRPLLDVGRIAIVRPPMMELVADNLETSLLAFSDEEGQRISFELEQDGKKNILKKRFRGLASLNADILKRHCVDPNTRGIIPLTAHDAESSIKMIAALSSPAGYHS
ncbi:MAG: toprim domain-containing protein [Pirellulaceae bacterium]|nr:toprim domain-containing protein [Pirellulaceae bacterium]